MNKEMDSYESFVNIVLSLLELSKCHRKNIKHGIRTIDENTSEIVFKLINDTMDKMPITATTLNQFVKIVKDSRRFKPMQNNSIKIIIQYNSTMIAFNDNVGITNNMIVFDNKEIKYIYESEYQYPYSEGYNYLIRNALKIYFKKCVDIILSKNKK